MQEDQYNIDDVCNKIQAMIEVTRNEGYDDGYAVGHGDGETKGYENGKREGYDEGYHAGQEDACERVSSVSSVDRTVRNDIMRRIRG